MKDFKDWGIKVRALKDYNYRAMWMNLKTVRFGESIEDIVELPPSLSEFYDVGIKIEVVIAVALGFPDELVGVVGEEVGGTLRLHILLIAVFEDGLDEVARDGTVFVEFQVVLAAVQDTDVDALVVRVPGDGGEVLLGGFARLDDDFLARGDVVDV